MIAITGATGAVGSRVARILAEGNRPLRLLVRDPGRVTTPSADVAVIRDYRDAGALRAGLAGCSDLFLVSARESADRVAEHRTVIEAASDAGVGRVVYLSFQGAAADCTFTFGRDHWHTEQLIREAGLAFVFLRDSLYQAGLVAMVGSTGVIEGPAGIGAVAAVAHDDVAATTAAALASDAWDGTTLDVTGPQSLTLAEVAELVSSVSGTPVRYVAQTEEEAYATRAHYAVPAFEVAGWVSSYQAIAAGELAAVSDTVRRLTGRAPTDFATYLRDHPESWRHLTR